MNILVPASRRAVTRCNLQVTPRQAQREVFKATSTFKAQAMNDRVKSFLLTRLRNAEKILHSCWQLPVTVSVSVRAKKVNVTPSTMCPLPSLCLACAVFRKRIFPTHGGLPTQYGICSTIEAQVRALSQRFDFSIELTICLNSVALNRGWMSMKVYRNLPSTYLVGHLIRRRHRKRQFRPIIWMTSPIPEPVQRKLCTSPYLVRTCLSLLQQCFNFILIVSRCMQSPYNTRT